VDDRQIICQSSSPSSRIATAGLYGWKGGYTIEPVTTWTFIWLMVLLKIPIVALFLLIRWAVREPEVETSEDGGDGPLSRPRHPHHPRSPLPRAPRRGPHGDPMPASPARIRAVVARGRLVQR
jgi:hypothetical protein